MRGHLFENLIVTEALKYRYNHGKDNNLYFYRNSNQQEIDLVIRHADALCGIEIKSSSTYNSEFENTLKKMSTMVAFPIQTRAIVYTGDLENRTGEIKLLNFKRLSEIL